MAAALIKAIGAGLLCCLTSARNDGLCGLPPEIFADEPALALVQGQVHVHEVRPGSSDKNLHNWGFTSPAATQLTQNINATSFGASQQENPFKLAFVVSLDPEKYSDAKERLDAQGVPSQPFWGFNGRRPEDLSRAMQLLRKYNNTEHLHETVGNFLACLHMSPGTPPRLGAAFHELFVKVLKGSPWNVQQMIDKDHHHCVPKMVAIAASHIRLWEHLAAGAFGDTDPEETWYLVMEDDAALCPGWRQRMQVELPMVPPDADIVKLFFFGHWRKEDQLPDLPDGTPSPFLMARDPMKGSDIARASTYEILTGHGIPSVPIAGFYAGTQAYLLKRRSAQKLLSQIRGKPFQDIDMTMMGSVKHYVWKKVMSMNAPEPDPKHHSLMQVVPVCNREPPKDWWFR